MGTGQKCVLAIGLALDLHAVRELNSIVQIDNLLKSQSAGINLARADSKRFKVDDQPCSSSKEVVRTLSKILLPKALSVAAGTKIAWRRWLKGTSYRLSAHMKRVTAATGRRNLAERGSTPKPGF